MKAKDEVLRNSILFATVSGSIGVLSGIPLKLYASLLKLQEALSKLLPSVGDMKHEDWRKFKNDYNSRPSSMFIDGDLVEKFLDLTESEKSRLLTNVQGEIEGKEELTLLIEKLSLMEV